MKEDILDKIANAKRLRISEKLKEVSLQQLKNQAEQCKFQVPSFKDAISCSNKFNVIAEIKKASPSKGLIQPDFHPVIQAINYEKAGAAAISVLTEQDFFLGNDVYFQKIREQISLPLLRKDFIINEMQIYESKCMGASAVLLIVALLDMQTLKHFLKLIKSLNMDALVEVHNEEELNCALQIGADIIGINNRDLKTFRVDLKVTETLSHLIPDSIVKISESGIKTAEDIMRIKNVGINIALIGESLMRSSNGVIEKMQEILGES